MTSLDLGVIGNGSYGALIDKKARIVWCCLPRLDGDPVFHHLLSGDASDEGPEEEGGGFWSIEVEDFASSRQ